jgi:spore coat protein U-like protein
MKTQQRLVFISVIFIRRLAMKKSNVAVCLSVAALIGTLLTPALSLAAARSQNMPVQAQVNVNCNFTSTPTMSFPSYDPADLNALPANPLAGSIGVNVRCTQGAIVTIGIDTGAHPGAVAGSTRAMQLGATTNRLGYDFYHEGTFTTLWTNSGGGLYSHTAVNNAPATVTIHGRVPGGQDVPAGTYDDIVVVTVTY